MAWGCTPTRLDLCVSSRRTSEAHPPRLLETARKRARNDERSGPRNGSTRRLPSQLKSRSVSPRQHFLYFLPLPQGQGSLRPILGVVRV